jgi:methionyl-tRNA formyltransferase
MWEGQPLKIHRAHAVDDVTQAPAAPGKRVVYANLPAFGTSHGLLVLDEVQPAGKKPMPGKVFLNGAREWA